jgi:regulator of sigma E protease
MNFLADLNIWGGWLTGYYLVVPFLFVLTIVVFFHELGHFLVARWCGVRVLVFSIGFGPELVGFNDRHGTRWKIAAIPLGGYVKFFGDENAASVPDFESLAAMSETERRQSYFHKSVWQRMTVVAAGPIANFILAIAIFAGLLMLYGKQEIAARVDKVRPNSAAEMAGFKPGDLVLSIDGKPIESFADMQRIVSASAGQSLEFVVDRGGVKTTLRAVPVLTEQKSIFGTQRVGLLGVERSISPGDVRTKTVSPPAAIAMAVGETWDIVDRTFTYLFRLVAGRESADQLGGPLGIAMMSGEAAKIGFDFLLRLAAAISVSIGLLNLFPIPLLDGGHLLFYGIEAVRGRPLSDRAQELGFRIGLAIVLMLMVFATANDIHRLFGRFRDWAGG